MTRFQSCLYALFFLLLSGAEGGDLLKPDDRIVFIGDSITGQGGRNESGWVALFGAALQSVDPDNLQTLVPLGGSGQTVGSWGNVERKSRDNSVFLDIKTYDVREELGQPADVVVIMLGMNDVLSAGLKNTPEGIEKWKSQYRDLIRGVRERATPRVMALATPTPCTEDPYSPKNIVMDQMVEALKSLADEESCIVLPTRDTAWEVLKRGRMSKPDFHFVSDQVHPNSAGHAMIASGMLKGLGETAAAEAMYQRALEKGNALNPGALSYTLVRQESEAISEITRFQLKVYHQDGEPNFELPDNWEITLGKTGEGYSDYDLSARLDREINRLTIRSGEQSKEVTIPAPWLVGTGNAGRTGWKSNVFDFEVGRLASDETIRQGIGFQSGPPELHLKEGVPLVWKTFVGDINYGGAGHPDVIDFAQVTYFTLGETGYGLRWVYSPIDRPISVEISRPGFAGNSAVELWLNGDTIHAGDPVKAKGRTYPAKLRKGWNLVSFKSNFWQWQWQLRISLKSAEGEALDDLKYSVFAL
ncbi:MAG: GDSL-type esterase/lipase family protein [Verrucomicrobiales bacterium]|nr:GDSL-type esterase/lipase family protein [Verrucomicrobiales bacterium]